MKWIAAFLIGCWVWFMWLDTLPQDYCATTHDFDVYKTQGITGYFWPNSDYRVNEKRKVCMKWYSICDGNRACVMINTVGYLK